MCFSLLYQFLVLMPVLSVFIDVSIDPGSDSMYIFSELSEKAKHQFLATTSLRIALYTRKLVSENGGKHIAI